MTFPFPMKGGRIVLPAVGDKVYVPAHGDPYLIGGLATVETIQKPSAYVRDTIIFVKEHPDAAYGWRRLRHEQMALHERYAGSPARVPTEEEVEAREERKRQAAAKVVADEAAKWAPQRFRCLKGALLEVPIIERHKRGRNWAAIIDLDPTGPSGLERFWFNRGRGPCKYIIPDELSLYDPIEFGADYVRGSGWKDPERWYGVVLAIAEDHLLVQPCKDAVSAISLSHEKKRVKDAERAPPEPTSDPPHASGAV